jgi:hypothetical protein
MSHPADTNPFENNVHTLPGRAAVTGNEVVDAADLPDGDDGPGIYSPGDGNEVDEVYGHTSTTTVKESHTVTDDEGTVLDHDEARATFDDLEIPSIEPDWDHETLEFAGHTFGVRYPSQQALTGFSMSTGAYVPELLRQNMVSMFLHRHFSPQSYLFLMARLMDPDDTEFDEDSFGAITRALIEASGDKITKELEAQAKAAKTKPRKR